MHIRGYIHGYPRKIRGHGYRYGWQISYPRQAWQNAPVFTVNVKQRLMRYHFSKYERIIAIFLG